MLRFHQSFSNARLEASESHGDVFFLQSTKKPSSFPKPEKKNGELADGSHTWTCWLERFFILF